MRKNNKNKYQYDLQKDENKGYRQFQTQEQIELTAHQKKLAFSVFHNTVEALEEYVEKIDCPNFKKQIFMQSINSPNRSSDDLADDFLTQLYCFKAILNKKPEFFRNEIKEEFYKWIDASGINVNNCPDKLKNYLFEINEILKGGGERFVGQMENKLNNSKSATPADALKVFSAFQNPINKNREQGELLKGKTHKDVKIESKFDAADSERGKEIFRQIHQDVFPKQNDFSFYQQNPQQPNLTVDEDTEMTDYSNEGSSTQRAGEYKWVNGQGWVFFPFQENPKTEDYKKREQSASKELLGESDNKKNNLGTISLITIILTLASLLVYGIVKKSRKK